jgi:hypothetical protein
MKNIKEIYQALLNGKTLRHKDTKELVDINGSMLYMFNDLNAWEIYDKFEDLKKAHAEGARFEFFDELTGKFKFIAHPNWQPNKEYRIKDNISLESWNKHKDLIKAWWDGAEIEFKAYNGSWKETDSLYWWADVEYRIKPSKWKMEPAKWQIISDGSIMTSYNSKVTIAQEFGIKFHSEEAAKKARDQMKRANLLRYLVSTMQDLDEGTMFIFKNSKNGKYYMDTMYGRDSLCEVYMTEKTAKKICKALNNGELKL